jgi:hypothetical protein
VREHSAQAKKNTSERVPEIDTLNETMKVKENGRGVLWTRIAWHAVPISVPCRPEPDLESPKQESDNVIAVNWDYT